MVRFKYRYFLVEYATGGGYRRKPTLTKDDILQAIKDSARDNFGEYGLSSIWPALQVKYFNDDTQTFIIRCSHAFHKILWASITLVTQVRGEPVAMHVLHIGATIGSCNQKAQQIGRETIHLIESFEVMRGTTPGADNNIPSIDI